jgi:hypothetical protein
MKTICMTAVVLILGGCAHAPLPRLQPHVAHKQTAIAHPAPSIAQTPNQTVAKRWYDRFKVHPKWFHG